MLEKSVFDLSIAATPVRMLTENMRSVLRPSLTPLNRWGYLPAILRSSFSNPRFRSPPFTPPLGDPTGISRFSLSSFEDDL